MGPVEREPVLDARRFGRTPVGFIIGLAICCLAALIALAVVVLRGPVPTLLSLGLAVLPVPLLIAGVLYIDRLEPEPRGLLLLIFGAGAAAAALILLAGSLGVDLPTAPPLGTRTAGLAPSVGAVIAGAIVAETLKGAVLVALLRFRRAELDGAHDGVVYASMTGLGFALVGNLHAYLAAERGGAGALANTFLLRGVVSPLWDPLFSSLIGIGVAYAAMRRGARGLWAVVAGWAAAVALRAMWDDSAVGGTVRTAVVYAILIAALAAVVTAVVMDRRRIVTLIAMFLPAYESAKVVTGRDVVMLGSIRWRRLARHWARLHRGLGGMRAMAVYQLAATELALACNRAERDLMEPTAFAARCEQSLGLMRGATSFFRDRWPDPPQPPWAGRDESAFGPPQPDGRQQPVT
jgi:RsiW-degrading membrane proteinase PrsW (M82 family)